MSEFRNAYTVALAKSYTARSAGRGSSVTEQVAQTILDLRAERDAALAQVERLRERCADLERTQLRDIQGRFLNAARDITCMPDDSLLDMIDRSDSGIGEEDSDG